MSFGMGMELLVEQRQEARPEARLALEQRLEQKLSQQMKLEMTMSQYLEQEDFVKTLLRYADSHDAWVDFDKHGFKFTYAAVPYRIAKPVADIAGLGFAHCMCNPFEGRERGEWTLFVVHDRIPEGLVDFVALHERGEEISLGDHYFASRLEFAAAAMERKVKPYTAFIEKKYPSKFVDLTQKVLFPILPKELLAQLTAEGRRNEGELARAEELIEKYPIPTSVLRRMDKYESLNERVCWDLKSLSRQLRKAVDQTSMAIALPPDAMAEAMAEMYSRLLCNILRKVKLAESNALSIPRMNAAIKDFYKTARRDTYDVTGKCLEMRDSFRDVYMEVKRMGRDMPVRLEKSRGVIGKSRECPEIHGYNAAANF
jgi:hypothetical protein